jgi:hypothetical protein
VQGDVEAARALVHGSAALLSSRRAAGAEAATSVRGTMEEESQSPIRRSMEGDTGPVQAGVCWRGWTVLLGVSALFDEALQGEGGGFAAEAWGEQYRRATAANSHSANVRAARC